MIEPEENEAQLQASSPDEIALVKFGNILKMKLSERTRQTVGLKNIRGNEEEYQVLEMFPFTSETKKMGILLKHLPTDRIIYLLKGAEVVIEAKINA